MKKNLIISALLTMTFAMSANAQRQHRQHNGNGPRHEMRMNDRPHFSPEEFKQRLERYIIKHADLTDEEAKYYFPIHNEMFEELRKVNDEMRTTKQSIKKESSEKEASAALAQLIFLKEKEAQIQAAYYKKMSAKMSSVKLMRAIKAVDKFHREIFRPGGKKQ